MLKNKRSKWWKKVVVYAVGILTVILLGFFSTRSVYAVPGLGENGEMIGCESETFDLLTPDRLLPGSAFAAAGEGETLAGAGENLTETAIPLVLIVIGFENLPYSDELNWNEVIFASEKSLSQYYRDMSLDKFTFVPARETSAFGKGDNTNAPDLENDGVIHVKLPTKKNTAWYSSTRIYNANTRKEEYTAFLKALTEAGKYLDFSSYDVNGNKVIDTNELAVSFVVAGYNMAISENTGLEKEMYLYVWPYSSDLKAYNTVYLNNTMPMPVVDGVQVANYIAVAEKIRFDDGDLHEDMGSFAHELGHYIGLPDLYTNELFGQWLSYDVGHLSLMAGGNYGWDKEGNRQPFSLDIWSRVKLGWVEPRVLGISAEDYVSDLAGSLAKDAEAPVALRMNTNFVDEYFLIENRRFTGWDEGMAFEYREAAMRSEDGGGLLIWHIEEEKVRNPRASVNNHNGWHPGVMPVFKESTDEEEAVPVGTIVHKEDPFFDRESWWDTVFLPLYGREMTEWPLDGPGDRKTTRFLSLSLDSSNASVMRIHRHLLQTPIVHWSPDYSFAELWIRCEHCGQLKFAEKSDKVTSKVVKNGSATSAVKKRFTVQFLMDDIKEYRDINLPIIFDENEMLRQKAYGELEKVLQDARVLPHIGPTYTTDSWHKFYDYWMAAEEALQKPGATADELRKAKDDLVAAYDSLVLADLIYGATVKGKKTMTFTGEPLTPKISVTLKGKRLAEGKDYTVKYKKNVHPGKATLIINGTGLYVGEIRKTFTIVKAPNTLAVSGKSVSVSSAKTDRGDITAKRSKLLKVSKPIGAVTYKILKMAPDVYIGFFKIDEKTGKLTVRKGVSKGTYRIKIAVTAAGNTDYAKTTKSAIVTVKVV